ncbi:MAG: hypothetical protein L6R40_000595 [Gallowayella cf. fulva]|nr:MAG: hypothetical protein L6R40_000595 [Xanthomendoza cf. fulva]
MSPHIVEGDEDLAEIIGDQPSEPFPHLWTRLSEYAVNYGGRPALWTFHQPVNASMEDKRTTEKEVWTYSQLHANVERFATRLYGLGVRKGDAIAAFLDNRVEWALLFWVSIRLDAVFVPLNPRFIQSKEEIHHVLQVTRPKVLAVLGERDAKDLERIAAEQTAPIPTLITVSPAGNDRANAWTVMSDLLFPPIHQDPTGNGSDENLCLPSALNDMDQTMVVVFTSGTTSLPKASFSTYQNLIAAALACKSLRHLDSSCTLLQHLPVFHSWSIGLTMAFWLTGATVVYPSRSFDARASLAAIESACCTHMPAVPSMIQALVSHPALSDTNLQSLQSIDLAGTMVLPEILAACMDYLKVPDATVIYGMTEGNFICGSDMYDVLYTRHSIPTVLSCGTATPGGRLRVCKPSSREVLKRGEIGELHIGGLQVTKGYLDRKSEDFYQEDGINWLVTGDQARIDDRSLVYILGRYKDLIIRGGENLSPASIERCLDSIVGIIDSQVIGIPDEVAGEVPAAIVRKSPELELSNHQIQQKLSLELGKICSPQYIFELHQDLGLADYPRTLSGKIKKRDLKDTVSEQMARASNGHQSNDQNTSTIDTLIGFWARVSGRTADSIAPNERADTFADSIMMMQFCNLVGKELSKIVAVEDLVGDVSIEKQAQIVDDRPVKEKSSPRKARNGPPTAADMVHVLGDNDAARRCQQKVESMLQPHGLSWDDVEDVVPTAQTVALMTRRTRLRNWNRRHAYHVPGASVEELQRVVTTCLEYHPTFRSMILDHGKEQPLYIILRPNHRWQQLVISRGYQVENPEDLKTLHFEDDSIDYAAPPGPLFKIMIVAVRSTNAAGLIFPCHHTSFDALSMAIWFEDLDMALRTRKPPRAHADFKHFAEMKYRYRDSPNADKAVAFHVDRLKGYTNHRAAIFPSQRAPQTFRGSDSGWTHVDGTPGQPHERRILDRDPQGVAGINGTITLPRLSRLKSEHGITSNIVFKAALALQNVHHTNATQAFFGQGEASRVWPTPTGSPDPDLPNTMDIPGPTWEVVINRVHVKREQTVLSFLWGLQEEQALLTEYAQAPFQRIETALIACGDRPETKHELHDSFFQRQCFNWLPPLHKHYTHLEEMQSLSRADIGLQWNFCHADAEKGIVRVNAAYDDCQMRAAEVEGCVAEVLGVAEWICMMEGEGAGRGLEATKVGECPLLHTRLDSRQGR